MHTKQNLSSSEPPSETDLKKKKKSFRGKTMNDRVIVNRKQLLQILAQVEHALEEIRELKQQVKR